VCPKGFLGVILLESKEPKRGTPWNVTELHWHEGKRDSMVAGKKLTVSSSGQSLKDIGTYAGCLSEPKGRRERRGK